MTSFIAIVIVPKRGLCVNYLLGRRCTISTCLLFPFPPLRFMSLNNNSSSSSSSSSNSKPSAVSSVVNDLIRAAVGGDARNVGDEDLDKYVADMILKEAEAKSKKYQSVGVSAYMPE